MLWDKHACLSSFRGNPKYHADSTIMFRIGWHDADGPQFDEFLLLLDDFMLNEPACGIYAYNTTEYGALGLATSWFLCQKLSEARFLAMFVTLREVS